MCNNVVFTLPNPTPANDPSWDLFANFLSNNSVGVIRDNTALNAYQNSDEGGFLAARFLNHCLNLQYYGVSSQYAELAENNYGKELGDYCFDLSMQELDSLFNKKAINVCDKSIVYKGISNEPFYQCIDFANKKVNDEICFPGFLSTTVCMEVAEKFSKTTPKIILEITGLNQLSVIIPEVRTVQSSCAGNIPEQEVLLNRDACFVVTNIQGPPDKKIISIKPK